ncbi:uncharacterized protein [Musca autumnalis]|uniref:uncharacterized protein n=1 Tax=Musca autumnalis TaxID=221902 RepID=UPI003CF33122
MENIEETCRTCLAICKDDLVRISDIAVYANPQKTYLVILRDMANLMDFGDQEDNMPQNLCSRCCEQIQQMYLFMEQIKYTNQQLSSTIDEVYTNGMEVRMNVMEDSDVKTEINNRSEEVAPSTGIEEHYLEVHELKKDYLMEEEIVECNVTKTELVDVTPYTFDILQTNCDNNDDHQADNKKTRFKNHNDDDAWKMLTKENAFFSCIYCPKTYVNKWSLNTHLMDKHQQSLESNTDDTSEDDERHTYKCKFCKYSARTSTALSLHKRSKHHGKTKEKIFKCKFCIYSSVKNFDIFSHIKKSHLSFIKLLRRKHAVETCKRENQDIAPLKRMDDTMENIEETQLDTEVNNESCSSGDEQYIRDILNIKRRSPRSNKKDTKSKSQSETQGNVMSDNEKTNVKEQEACPECGKNLNCDDLKTHMLLEHRGECSDKTNNDLEVETKTKEKKSLDTMSKSKLFHCRLCDYTSKTSAGLHFHRHSKHGNENDRVKCCFCPRREIRKFDMFHHIKKNHLDIVKAIKKELRESKLDHGSFREPTHESTEAADALHAHDIKKLIEKYQNPNKINTTTNDNLEVSSGDETTIRKILKMKKRSTTSELASSLARRCENCGNIYKNSQALSNHRNRVHRICSVSQCPHCDCKYKREYDLKLHIKAKHTAQKSVVKRPRNTNVEKRYMCTECSYTCSTFTCLTIHTHRHHTGEKPYQCEYCPKAFVVKADLNTHRYLHTGERPYKCPTCSKGFRDKNHMQRHARIHLDVKPYICKECGKGFTKTYNLKVHQRTHTKEQRPKCLVCGKYFKDQAQLNVHQISEDHHDEKNCVLSEFHGGDRNKQFSLKMSIRNRNNKCRTCLKSGTKLQPISTKPKMMKVDKTYMELINHIAQVEFDTDDEHKMPQGICSICSKKIRDSYTFIKQVRKCNTIFLKSTITMPDENPLDKLEESFATENVLLDECDDNKSIKEEVNPFDDEEMNAAPKKEELDSDSSSSFSNDNFAPDTTHDNDDNDTDEEFIKIKEPAIKANVAVVVPPSSTTNKDDDDVAIKTEENEQKDEQTELFPECVLNEKVFSDDDSLSELDSIKAEDDPTYDPLESGKTKTKRAPKAETLDDEDKNLPVPCEDCDRVFQNANLLKRHKKDTHLPDELKVQCPHCTAKFSRRHNMYTHMRTLHKIEPVIEQKANPKRERNSVKCEHCQKSYCNKYKLMDHIKRKHGPDSDQPKKEKIKQPAKRFLCALCGFTCNSQPNLDVHYRRHTGERPFKCDHCDRRFYRMYDVQMHNLSHTGERPFKCTVCEKAFRRSGKLKIHMRTHTNERPYKCTECEKAFKQSKDLTVHRRIHTGERPYKCNVCESTFIQSNSLRLHQTKTKHSNDPVNPINNTTPGVTSLMNNVMNNNVTTNNLLNNVNTNAPNISHNSNPPPITTPAPISHPNIPTNNAVNNSATGNNITNTNSNPGDTTKYPDMIMNKML